MKKSTSPDKVVDDYLLKLKRALGGVSASRRNQIVDDIAVHIEDGRLLLDMENESTVRALLNRIGDPASIAAEAGGAAERTARRRSDSWVPWLLLFGGVVGLALPLLGVAWLVGVALLWTSTSWSIGQKLLGTFILPGGLLPLAIMLLRPVEVASCSSYGRPGIPTVEHCSASGFTFPLLVGIPVFLVALVAPIVTAVYLLRVEQRGRTATDA